MSAHSFITHRLFVAALNHDEPAAANVDDHGPAIPYRSADPTSDIYRQHHGTSSGAGVLLANAMLNGYQRVSS